MLNKLLENINLADPSGMEETRMRASTLLCKVFIRSVLNFFLNQKKKIYFIFSVKKNIPFLFSQVFLQHLSPLLSLATFTALWLTILDFMEKYMSADRSDLLVSLFFFIIILHLTLVSM